MMADPKTGCTCFDETTRKCPIHPANMGHRLQYGIERCPFCDASLVGEMIPVERRGHIGADRYSRLITKLEAMICPDCRTVIDL